MTETAYRSDRRRHPRSTVVPIHGVRRKRDLPGGRRVRTRCNAGANVQNRNNLFGPGQGHGTGPVSDGVRDGTRSRANPCRRSIKKPLGTVKKKTSTGNLIEGKKVMVFCQNARRRTRSLCKFARAQADCFPLPHTRRYEILMSVNCYVPAVFDTPLPRLLLLWFSIETINRSVVL